MNDIDYIYKNIEKYSPGKERKISVVFDDVIADMLSDKKLFFFLIFFPFVLIPNLQTNKNKLMNK